MASYTDTGTPVFKPYVQQLPISAMVDVGVRKQAQYDEGYQRIQSTIDKVAGLSVMRDVDKQYLQSKMNELGNNLKMVSMGDFSNYQLVNSVGGMVNQVGKDKYIQSAVMSTARVQKELGAIESLRKEGKSDKNNEAYFHEKILNPYLSAGLKDANGSPISFNGSFSPYVDVTDEVRKLAKEAGVDESIIQQMYATDPNGKIQFAPDGSAIPARTMTEVTSSSNAKAIEGILNAVLNRGDVQNQIGIDAWANTRGVDPVKMLSGYEQKFNEVFTQNDAEKIRLATLLTGKISDEQKKEIEDDIKTLDKQKDKYKNQLAELTSLAVSDPEGFKERMYKTNYENSLRDIFIKTKREAKNLDSPLIKQMNWEQDFDLKYKSEQFDRGIALRVQSREDLKFDLDYPIDPLTGKRYKSDGKPKPPSEGEQRVSSDNAGTYIKTGEERNDEMLNTLDKRSYETGFDLMYDIYRRSGFPTAQEDRKDLFKKDIEKEAAQAGITPQQYVSNWIKELDINAKIRGIQLAPRDRQIATQHMKDRENYLSQIAITKEINEDAEQKYGTDVNKYLSSLIPASVTLSNGKTISFTKRDMIDYALYDSDPKVKQRVDNNYGNRTGLLSHITDVLKMKYGDNEYTVSNSPEWKSIKTFHDLNSEKFKKAAEERETKYKEIFADAENIAISGGETEAEKKATQERVYTFVSNNSNLFGKNFDRDGVLKALNKSETKISFAGASPSVEGTPWTGEIVIGDTRIVVEKQTDLEYVTNKKFNNFVYNKYLAIAKTSGTHSTNLGADVTDKQAWKTSKFHSDIFTTLNSQFSSDSKYIVLGADLNLMYNKKEWSPTIYVQNRETKEYLNLYSGRMYNVGDENSAILHISQITESALDRIVNDNKRK